MPAWYVCSTIIDARHGLVMLIHDSCSLSILIKVQYQPCLTAIEWCHARLLIKTEYGCYCAAGAYIGPTLGMIASGMLNHHWGWQYVFYFHGIYDNDSSSSSFFLVSVQTVNWCRTFVPVSVTWIVWSSTLLVRQVALAWLCSSSGCFSSTRNRQCIRG